MKYEKEWFILNLTKNIPHGNKTFFEHLYNTSKIIEKKFPDKDYLIDAGLFHSIYGTCYFDFKNNLSRNQIKKIIGSRSEEIVYLFCTLENRTDKILEHKFEEPLQQDLYILEYANLLDQVNDTTLKYLKDIENNFLKYYNLNLKSQ